MIGTSGEIRAGYIIAARLGAWEHYPRGVVGEVAVDGSWGVMAELREHDRFWLEYGGRLELILEVGDKRWRWLDVTVQLGKRIVVHGVGAPQLLDA